MTGSWPRIHSLSSMLAPSHATNVSRKYEDSVQAARHNTANAPIVTARGILNYCLLEGGGGEGSRGPSRYDAVSLSRVVGVVK